MKPISLVINGRPIAATIEPRTSLVDFLRDHRHLTATHVGCEHGVCGACTILIDGVPARSCITLAVATDGAAITTLEGLHDDPTTNVLREAFAEHHGLQCGFCTPGMLMTARDIAIRLPHADAERVRLELAGNLCRCTGYVGIVKAIGAALTRLQDAPPLPSAVRGTGPVGAHRPAPAPDRPRTAPPTDRAPTAPIAPAGAEHFDRIDWAAVERDGVELRQSFAVPFPLAEVWRVLADIDQVVRCIPGARLTAAVDGGRAEGEVNVKLGPIVSTFRGTLDVTRDDTNHRGLVRGAGRDARSPSSARSIIAYDVTSPATSATSSRVDLSVKFLLSGALAQFSRSGLVKDVADHLTREFASNLAARLSGNAAPGETAATLDAGAVARSAIWARLRALAAKLLGRGT